MEEKDIITINIKGSIIDKSCIEDCLKEYKGLKSCPTSKLHFIASQEITFVDISFIGHLILMKNEMPEIEILIELQSEKNILTGSFDTIYTDNIIGRLGLYAAHALYTLGQLVYTIKYKWGIINEVELKNNSKWIALSSKYMPIVFINEHNKNTFFDIPITMVDMEILLNDLKVYRSSGSKDNDLYQAIRRKLTVDINSHNYIEKLAIISYFRALADAKLICLSLYNNINDDTKKNLDIENLEDLHVGSLTYVETHNKGKSKIDSYFESINQLFNELQGKPAIYHLLFSTLISSKRFSPIINYSTIDNASINLQKLWEFTKELVYGLNEQGKNIIQHSTLKTGVITGYINNNNEFELNIFDYSSVGILKTFVNTLESRSPINNLIKEDIISINNGHFSFDSLFDGKEMLNEQSNRATAHLGILFFSRLIIHNCGRFVATSINMECDGYDTYSSSNEFNSIPTIGTSYFVMLPLKENINYEPYKTLIIPQVVEKNDEVESEYFNYYFNRNNKVFDSNDKKKLIFNITIRPVINNTLFDNKLWNQIGNSENQIRKYQIVSIDFEQLDTNSSQLFRFIGRWELNYPNIQLIIYNISTELLFNLKDIIKSYYLTYTHLPFWNESKMVLFYSFEIIIQKNQLNKFYFTDLIWGSTENDFWSINTAIGCNNYNAFSLENKVVNNKSLPTNRLFDSKNNLISFDQLIEDKDSNTLFDVNTKTLLQNEIGLKVNNNYNNYSREFIIKQIENLQRHKLSSTHFRLGSKIHISDFFYAKSFFQNSYNANKYAASIAYYIMQEYFKSEETSLKELTLIGYGLYSELLVSSVKKLLQQNSFIKERINYNTINDSEEIKLNNATEKLYKNAIIIVPIASTFSTSLKIAEMLRMYEKKPEGFCILPIHINVLLVAHNELKTENGKIKSELLTSFGWKTFDKKNKIIKVEPHSGQELIKQKYFISLFTEWNKIQNCSHCFPDLKEKRNQIGFCNDFKIDNPVKAKNCFNCTKKCTLNERPLFATDKTSLTPELIFGLPKTRVNLNKSYINKSKISISSISLSYGHFKRNDNHYHYYFNDTTFWEINKRSVITWLENVKKYDFSDADSYIDALILAPGHFSNAEFVHLVNNIVFENKATIIHYESSIENTQNFEMFYGEYVQNAKCIYFVDDTATSGATFINANSFLKRIKNSNKYSNGTFKPFCFNACFFFLNRTGYYEYEDIKRKLNTPNIEPTIYSFADINLPYIKSFDKNCPLCTELKKYEVLYDNAYLDRIKKYFLSQQIKLKLEDIPLIENDKINSINTRKEFRVEAIHRIYQWINEQKEDINVTWEAEYNKWVIEFLRLTETPFNRRYLENSIIKSNGCLLSPASSCILKVLTQPPFINFIQIKKNVFNWVINLLDIKTNEIFISENVGYESFRELKFLIRRASILNSNYIISYKFFFMLKTLLSSKIFSVEEDEMRLFIKLSEFKRKPDKDIFPEIYKEILSFDSPIIEKQKGRKQEINDINLLPLEFNENELSSTLINNFIYSKISKENLTKYKILGIENAENQLKEIGDFSVFIVAQINELLHQNEARSIELEKRLLFFETNSTIKSVKFTQLLRMIREENGAIIRTFWPFFNSYFSKVDNKTIDCLKKVNDYQELMDFIEEHEIITKHYRYSLINNFLETNNGSKNDFFKYLFLKIFFESDKKHYEEKKKNNNSIKLEDKTKVILEKITEIILEKDYPICGSFMMVEYPTAKEDSCLLAYNEGTHKIIIEELWKTEENNFLYNFLKHGSISDQKNNISIIEFHNTSEGWIDLFSNIKLETGISVNILPKNSNLLLIRINKLELNERMGTIEDKSQGLLGFYYTRIDKKITDITKTRYLLLLKDDISKFIERHHESDEYRDWIEEKEKQDYKKVFWHGNDKLLEQLESYESKFNDNEIEYKFDVIIKLLRDKFRYEFEELKSNIDEKTSFIIRDKINDNERSILSIGSIISLISDILSIKNFKLSKNIRTHIENNSIKLFTNKIYFTIVFYEIVYNAIKNAKESGIIDKEVFISFNINEQNLVFKVSNTSSEISDEVIKLINKQGYMKRGGGLELSKQFLIALGSEIPTVKFNNKTFTSIIIFKNILDNE